MSDDTPNLIERVEEWLLDNPGRRITAAEGCERFGCTHNTWVQTLHEVRQRGHVRMRRAYVWWVDEPWRSS